THLFARRTRSRRRRGDSGSALLCSSAASCASRRGHERDFCAFAAPAGAGRSQETSRAATRAVLISETYHRAAACRQRKKRSTTPSTRPSTSVLRRALLHGRRPRTAHLR